MRLLSAGSARSSSAIPLLLGGILFLYTFPSDLETPFLVVVGKVVFVLGILGWPTIARLMRSSVLQVKPNDYVQAARALGRQSRTGSSCPTSCPTRWPR